jgi:hypothetical protein
MKRYFWMTLSILAVVALLIGAPPANAAITTLSDLNSTVTIDSGSQAGMSSWVVDGVNQLFQQWFWYRIGSTGGESSINTISAATVTPGLGTRQVDITYSNSSLSVDVVYTLTGGTAGTHTSDVAESIRITNTSSASETIHFFQYSDFDLNNTLGGQTVSFPNVNTVDQTGTGVVLSETVATPAPNERQASPFPVIVNSLNDANPTTLDGTNTAINTDATWGFQWDTTLGAGGSMLISKDKRLSASGVPEPASIVLLGSFLLGIGVTMRRRLAR